MEKDDLRYVYASAVMSGDVIEDAAAFQRDFGAWVLDNFVLPGGAAWTMKAQTKKGFIPVGIAFGYPVSMGASEVLELEAVWLTWASPRNKVESIVHLINILRQDYPLFWTARHEDRPFYIHMCKYGVARHIGKLETEDGPLSMFQSKARK